MKKLMIAAAIVCAAAISQAASFAWTSSGMTDEKGATLSQDYIAYGFYLKGDGTTAPVTAWTVEDAIAAVMAADALETDIANYAMVGNGDGTFGSDAINEGSGVASGTAQGFMIIVNQDYTSYDESGTYAPTAYSVVQGGEKDTVTVEKSTGSYTFVFGSAEQGDWQSVPEPTSGLLLLIGVAGLALKRRRA